MQKEGEVVEPYSGESFTKITFVPDFKRFQMKDLEDDTITLFRKRVDHVY